MSLIQPLGFMGGGDADALAYIANLISAGENPTGAQVAAINDFYASGKSEGWYSDLVRLYLPIWGAASPNSLDLIGGASGTWVGGVTHSAGYVQGNGTTGYFRTDAKIPAVASIEDVLVGTLNKTWHQAPNKIGIGSGATAGTSIRHGSMNSAGVPIAIVLGVNINGAYTGTAGINLSAREGGTTYLGQKLGAGSYGELSSTASLTSALDDHFVTVMGTATSDTGAGALSTSQIGGAVIATGMDATQRGEFVTAWEALWETTTGLTLP
tara:strand:+ start:66 stop:869 length:804 start_codon:yes stop_codon:yes gene_type:complete